MALGKFYEPATGRKDIEVHIFRSMGKCKSFRVHSSNILPNEESNNVRLDFKKSQAKLSKHQCRNTHNTLRFKIAMPKNTVHSEVKTANCSRACLNGMKMFWEKVSCQKGAA